MATLYGNREILSRLFRAAREEKPAGCYIIQGDPGTGKRTIARLAAAAFCCENKRADGSPCESCRNCQNILSGSHVDVRELFCEADKKTIPVEAVREFLKASYVLPTESDWRVYIMDASALTVIGQNTILKSIEEVRPKSVFFLLTNDASRLLPTVRSRSVMLKTESLSVSQIREILTREIGQSEKMRSRVELTAKLCGGSLGKAREMIRSDLYFSQRELVLQYFSVILEGGGFTKLSLICPPGGAKREEMIAFLSLAREALLDLILEHYSPGTDPRIFENDDIFHDLANVLSPARAVSLFRAAEEMLGAADAANVFSTLSNFHLQAHSLAKRA